MDRGSWQGYSPCSCKRVRHNLVTKQQQSQEYACGDLSTFCKVWSFFLSVITGYHEMLSIELNYHAAQEYIFFLYYLQFLRSTKKEARQKLLAYPRVVCKGTYVPF